MKRFQKMIPTVLAVVVFLAAVFAAGRFGWRLLGFRGCQGAGITSVEVDTGVVEIRGFYPGSFPEGFCGYYAQERDGRLYVGFRFSALFGSFHTGDFAVTIPVSGEIHEVILKTRTDETGIWTQENDAAADVSDIPGNSAPVLTLPILDEIDESVSFGTADSSRQAVQAAVKLLDWGAGTGLDVDEIRDAATAWLGEKDGDEGIRFAQKLTLVDDAYQKLLDSAGSGETEKIWGNQPLAPIEAVMEAAGLR